MIMINFRHVLPFAQSKPADEKYDAFEFNQCAMAQFASYALGVPCSAGWVEGSVIINPPPGIWADDTTDSLTWSLAGVPKGIDMSEIVCGPPLDEGGHGAENWTWGQLASRLEAAIEAANNADAS